jgi:hypothetical protein
MPYHFGYCREFAMVYLCEDLGEVVSDTDTGDGRLFNYSQFPIILVSGWEVVAIVLTFGTETNLISSVRTDVDFVVG